MRTASRAEVPHVVTQPYLGRAVPGPAKLLAAFTYLTQNFPDASLTMVDFYGCCEAVVDSLDPAAIPADLLLLPADLVDTEASDAAARSRRRRRTGARHRSARPARSRRGRRRHGQRARRGRRAISGI